MGKKAFPFSPDKSNQRLYSLSDGAISIPPPQKKIQRIKKPPPVGYTNELLPCTDYSWTTRVSETVSIYVARSLIIKKIKQGRARRERIGPVALHDINDSTSVQLFFYIHQSLLPVWPMKKKKNKAGQDGLTGLVHRPNINSLTVTNSPCKLDPLQRARKTRLQNKKYVFSMYK